MSDQPCACACNIRKKVAVGILGVLPEDACGIPDSALADYMRFDLAGPNGEPVLAFRFCPWCSLPIQKEERITHVEFDVEEDEREPWQKESEDE